MWARRDSNPQPSDYESPALTFELQARKIKKFEQEYNTTVVIFWDTKIKNWERDLIKIKSGGQGGTRTHTEIALQRILSPLRLPIPPLGHDIKMLKN